MTTAARLAGPQDVRFADDAPSVAAASGIWVDEVTSARQRLQSGRWYVLDHVKASR